MYLKACYLVGVTVWEAMEHSGCKWLSRGNMLLGVVLRVYSLTPLLVHTHCFLRVDKSVLSQFPDAIYGLSLGTIS